MKFIHHLQIILLVYDITNAASFIRVNDWLAALRKLQMDSSPNIALIANKSKYTILTIILHCNN